MGRAGRMGDGERVVGVVVGLKQPTYIFGKFMMSKGDPIP